MIVLSAVAYNQSNYTIFDKFKNSHMITHVTVSTEVYLKISYIF